MGKVPWLVALAVVAVGCCSRGRFPSDVKGYANVGRDDYVERWKVNGDKVCPRVIAAAPGCYVLEVEYGASYVKHHGDEWFVAPVGPAVVVGRVEHTTRAEYHSGTVPFALRVRERMAYYVTTTFTGQYFLPRIVELNEAGERIGQIEPARTSQELAACKAGQPAPPSASRSASAGDFSLTTARVASAEPDGCD